LNKTAENFGDFPRTMRISIWAFLFIEE